MPKCPGVCTTASAATPGTLSGAYFRGLGWQRLFLLFATRPQDLQMNLGLFTSFLIAFRSRLQEQQVKAHNLLSPQL